MTDALYRLPPDLKDDIDRYEDDVRRFLSGELRRPVFRSRRVPRGVYEQRQDGTYMLRVRVAGGALTHAQAVALAGLSRRYGNGRLHVTTRQDVQFHDVAIEHTPAIMRDLMAVGLSSKGGGGNTVRNVTTCPYAGICPHERFDVTPAALAVTEHLIPLVGNYNLPRKYKIALSGCSADCALAQVADLGLVAECRGGRPGFRVWAGGGMGAHSRVADVLEEWVPAGDAIRVAEAVRRLFDEHGDRANKHKARLRFVFERLGLEACRARFRTLMADVAREGVPEWIGPGPAEQAREPDGGAGWPPERLREGVRVTMQWQPGHVAVSIPLPLGFVSADHVAALGELSRRFSRESGLRMTRRQGALIRFVAERDLPALAAAIRSLGVDPAGGAIDRFVSCAGASTCRLGLCMARGAARACAEALAAASLPADALQALEFHINGCSNACGQQPIAPVGFFGVAQRVNGRLVPSYRVTLGGRCGSSGARLGAPVGQVAARALPDLVVDLARAFCDQRRPGESLAALVDRVGVGPFERLVSDHSSVPPYEQRPDFYRDFGVDADFTLAGRGSGECGAGVFEVIQEDLAAARRGRDPFDVLVPAARALLVTRGVDAQAPDAVLREFEKHFVDSGLVAEEFRVVLTRGRGRAEGWRDALCGHEEAVSQLLARVELLYATLDANLDFHPPGAAGAAAVTPPAEALPELDLRGVACPMNFVKAKLRLEGMAVGGTLAVVLDSGAPIENVPASFRGEGQEIVSQSDLGDGHWRVVIRRRV